MGMTGKSDKAAKRASEKDTRKMVLSTAIADGPAPTMWQRRP